MNNQSSVTQKILGKVYAIQKERKKTAQRNSHLFDYTSLLLLLCECGVPFSIDPESFI